MRRPPSRAGGRGEGSPSEEHRKNGNSGVTNSPIPKKQLVEEGRRARAEVLAGYVALRDADPRDEAAVLTARNALVTVHMPFVVSMATRRARTGGHLEVADLVQAGALGAMRACESYDPERSSFLTYAAWWIRSAINGALEGETTIRQPAGVLDDVRRLRRAENAHETRTGQRATVDELAAEMKTTPGHVVRLIEARRLHVTSLDEDREDEQGAPTSLHDLIADDAPSVEDDVTRGETAQVIREIVARLPERERVILERRCEGETLSAIGDTLSLSRERVRQVEQDGLRVLRNEARARGLVGELGR
jgi:RNA polymerase sigma factor (sigma-70 family)